MRKLTLKLVKQQIVEARGNISTVAARLTCTRATIYKFLEKNPILRETLDEARETMIDNVESNLYTKALAGDVACMIFFLKTQGRFRGYRDQVQVDANLNLKKTWDLEKLDSEELSTFEQLAKKAQADE